jgi:hypothetical protein
VVVVAFEYCMLAIWMEHGVGLRELAAAGRSAGSAPPCEWNIIAVLREWRVEPGQETEIHDNLVQCYPKTLYYTLAWKGPDEWGHTLASFETTLR